MKKILTFILMLSMLFTTILPTAVNASDNTEVTVIVDGAEYTAHIGDVVRYACYLDLSGIDLGNGSKPGRITEFEGMVYYNANSMKLLTALEDENGGFPPLPTLTGGSIVVSNDSQDALRYNGIFLKGYSFEEKKIFLRLDFKITGSEDLYISHLLYNLGSGDVKLIYCGAILFEPDTDVTVEIGCPHDAFPVGDTDLDGVVAVIDASMIQLWLSDMKDFSLRMQINADFNCDDSVDITDVTAIQRKVAGLDYRVFN